MVKQGILILGLCLTACSSQRQENDMDVDMDSISWYSCERDSAIYEAAINFIKGDLLSPSTYQEYSKSIDTIGGGQYIVNVAYKGISKSGYETSEQTQIPVTVDNDNKTAIVTYFEK